MKSVDELKENLALAKTDEAYHRKQMEYQLEQIKIIEEQIKQHQPFANKKSIFTRSGKINDMTAVVKCQNCGKNDVVIMKNHAYFGIICSECSKKNTVFTTK